MVVDDRLQCIEHAFKFSVATDHGYLDAFDTSSPCTKSTRFGALDDINLDRLGLAFDTNRLERLDIERTAHLAVCIVSNKNAADRKQTL